MVLGSGQGRNNGNLAKSVRPPSNMSTFPEEEEDVCTHCGSGSSGKQKSKKWSYCTIIFLLAVDAFTIGLVLALFSHHSYHNGKSYE